MPAQVVSYQIQELRTEIIARVFFRMSSRHKLLIMKVGRSQSVSRIMYGQPSRADRMTIHLGPTLPPGSSGLPVPPAPRGARERVTLCFAAARKRQRWGGTYLALLRVGFAKPACHHAAGALLPHHFTLTHVAVGPIMQRGRCLFCGTFREVTLPGRYPAPYPVESGLSSRPSNADRQSSDRLRPLPT